MILRTASASYLKAVNFDVRVREARWRLLALNGKTLIKRKLSVARGRADGVVAWPDRQPLTHNGPRPIANGALRKVHSSWMLAVSDSADLWNSRQRGADLWHARRALFEPLCF